MTLVYSNVIMAGNFPYGAEVVRAPEVGETSMRNDKMTGNGQMACVYRSVLVRDIVELVEIINFVY